MKTLPSSLLRCFLWFNGHKSYRVTIAFRASKKVVPPAQQDFFHIPLVLPLLLFPTVWSRPSLVSNLKTSENNQMQLMWRISGTMYLEQYLIQRTCGTAHPYSEHPGPGIKDADSLWNLVVCRFFQIGIYCSANVKIPNPCHFTGTSCELGMIESL